MGSVSVLRTPRVCSIPECRRPVHAQHDWCRLHLTRWRRTGDPLGVRTRGRKPTVSLVDRLTRSLDTSGECWLWTGSIAKTGYGQFTWRTQVVHPHRVMMEFMLAGPIPEGMYVCHHCDTPLCCRPQHLFLGTAKDNSQDCVRKGRHSSHVHPMARSGDKHWTVRHPEIVRRGEQAGAAKLTRAQVEDIRSRYRSEKITQTVLAHQYGVSQSVVSEIILETIWK